MASQPPSSKPFPSSFVSENVSEDFARLQKRFEEIQNENEKQELLKRLHIAEVRAEKAEAEARQAQPLVREAMNIARKAEARAAEAERKLTETQGYFAQPSTSATTQKKSPVWDVTILKQKVEQILNAENEPTKNVNSVAVQTEEQQGEILGARKLKNAVDRARKKAEQKVKQEEVLRKEADEKVKLLEAQLKEERKKVKEYDDVLKSRHPDYQQEDVLPDEWVEILEIRERPHFVF